MVQYSCALNASISSSRSTIMRKAGDCTRPAESPVCTLRQSTGERLKPTRWSSARRACCASTELVRDAARVRHRVLDRLGRDLAEHDAMQRLVLEQPALAQDLGDVPADRLALAIQVGREIERRGALRGARDRVHVALVLLDQLVAHGEVVLGVDRALARDQVAHVAVRGQHGELGPEVLVDGLRLGGRLDDKQVFCHEPMLTGRGTRGFRAMRKGRFSF
jgi:hypothetical protein